jgi:hypothetical protein
MAASINWDAESRRWPGGLLAFLLQVARRSMVTVLRGEVIGALFWPMIVAGLIWLVVGLLAWEPVTTLLSRSLESVAVDPVVGAEPSAVPWWAVAFAVGVKFVFWLGLVPLVYVTALVLIALWTLPGLIRRIAQRDYPELAFRHGGSGWVSLRQTLVASLLFLLGLIGTLLLWWIPGALLLFPFLLTAWLNQRTFVYDCLSEVADARELATLPSRYRGWLFAVGALGALLAWLPVVNLFAPILVGVLFAHATLSLLSWERLADQPLEEMRGSANASQTAPTNHWELLP